MVVAVVLLVSMLLLALITAPQVVPVAVVLDLQLTS